MINFEEYLIQKKIDPVAFKAEDQEQWSSLEKVFLQVHPKSFTAQKLYLINPLRRRFPLEESQAVEKVASSKPSKPILRRKPKPKT